VALSELLDVTISLALGVNMANTKKRQSAKLKQQPKWSPAGAGNVWRFYVDREVYSLLAQQAKGTETPNEVLHRLLVDRIKEMQLMKNA